MARIQTTAAIAAAEMRKRLKAAGIAATVKSSNFAGGNSVDIGLTDAPPDVVAKAHKICDPFQYGHFDGMVDCYEYSNKRTDLPAQAKYVHVNLRTTPAMELGFESDAECEAVRWARSAYWPLWRTRLRTRPETMREDLRHFYYHPFGRADWNEYMKLARRWIARNEKLPSFPEVCPYCAERDANLAMEKAS